jgi:hypothetical protein
MREERWTKKETKTTIIAALSLAATRNKRLDRIGNEKGYEMTMDGDRTYFTLRSVACDKSSHSSSQDSGSTFITLRNRQGA